MSLILLLTGCLERPYPPYFPDGPAPEITSVEAADGASIMGGADATIQGTNLGTTKTVVVGGRNAEILSVNDTEVQVILPSHAPTRGPIDVAIATETGFTRAEAILDLDSALGRRFDDERISVALGTLNCPIEQYGLIDGQLDTIYFCGGELGYADGIAFGGVSPQPGYATELLGFAPLSTAPPIGEKVFWGPGDRRPPGIPAELGPQAAGDAIVLSTTRDFDADFSLVEEALTTIERTYFWAFAIDETALIVQLENEEEVLGLVDVVNRDSNTITLESAAPPGTTLAQLGYRFVERYEDGSEFETLAFFGTAPVTASETTLTGIGAGVSMVYDEFTGFWFPQRFPGPIDNNDFSFDVSTVRLGESTRVGSVRGAPPLEGLLPDLMTGGEVVDSSARFTMTFDPIDDPDAIVVLEVKVYDLSINDPNGQTEVFRISSTALDADGEVSIPAALLEQLPPRIDNEFDDNYDFVGLWGEITLARHITRVLPGDDGDVVVDFVNATTANVAFIR